jgi:hypothetical protein
MKKIRMIEFQYVEGGKVHSISDQFNEWVTETFMSGLRILQVTSDAIHNKDGMAVETLFVMYDYFDEKPMIP